MLRATKATIYKEWLVLRRDTGGLLLLLLMPAALIIIMALVQDAPFRDYADMHFTLLLADEDSGPLATEIREGLASSHNFSVLPKKSAAALKEALQRGQEHIGIIIPHGASAEVANAANTVANALSSRQEQLPQRPQRDSISIRLLFDPASKPAFRVAIRAALDKYITAATAKILVQRLQKLSGTVDSAAPPDMSRIISSVGIREESLGGDVQTVQRINSVQHNVPAWAIFGMFFIVVPLSGHIIREREEGSALRVRLIPGASRSVGFGRIVFYTIVCCAQAALMAAVGRWLLPLFGLSALQFGAHPWVLFPIIIAVALCATAYGFFVGSLFRSGTQALPFGAISVVILSALGGIWVPVEVLSRTLQIIAEASPPHWALDGVQTVMLRDGNFADVLLPVSMLLAVSALLWLAGIAWGERRLA